MQEVCYIFRKPNSSYFSIEKIFCLVISQLKNTSIYIKKIYIPESNLTIKNLFQNFLTVIKNKSDIIHVTGDVHYLVLALPSKQTVLTIHDCVFMYQSKGIKRLLLYYLFLKWPVRRCKYITTISERTKADIIRYTRCPDNKIKVIPNPVSDTVYFKKKEFNIQNPSILFIGTASHKNLERSIEALKEITCQLEIVGNLSEELQSLLKQYKICFTSSLGLTDEQLAQKYADADIVLFPSTFEGFGLPIIEGQKAGRVVITSNMSPMKEVAGNGACLVDPFDSESIRSGIVKVIRDEDYRNSLIQNGFKNVHKYSPEYIASQYMELYQQVINENK